MPSRCEHGSCPCGVCLNQGEMGTLKNAYERGLSVRQTIKNHKMHPVCIPIPATNATSKKKLPVSAFTTLRHSKTQREARRKPTTKFAQFACQTNAPSTPHGFCCFHFQEATVSCEGPQPCLGTPRNGELLPSLTRTKKMLQ